MASLTTKKIVGAEAVTTKGWLIAHKWLLMRRISQLSIILLFVAGPLWGIWLIKGSMSSSLLLETVPLSDPFVYLQVLLSGQVVEKTVVVGAVIVALFYFVVGGRVYCSWVCPINMVTDAADWLRRILNIKTKVILSRSNRTIIFFSIMAVSVVSGAVVWELVNPVTMLQREIVFGMGLSWMLVVAIFIVDAFISRRAWCAHLCPMGRFYSFLGKYSILRINALQRSRCDDCMDCFAVCPEPQVIKSALKGNEKSSPVILSGDCTNCGQCIDVCALEVFSSGHRFLNPITEKPKSETSQHEVSL